MPAPPPRVLRAGAALLAVGLLGLVAARLLRGRPVETVRIGRSGFLETLVVSGRVLERSKASLGAPVTGTVAEVLFEEGDRVKAGQLLVRLDEREAAAGLARARARLDRVVGTDRRTALEELRKATLVADQAERELARVASLRDEGFVSLRDADDARDARDLARSALASARARADAAREGGVDERDARADVASAAARLEQHRVRAPGPGVVLARSV